MGEGERCSEAGSRGNIPLMSSTTGTKIAVGVAIAGVATIVIAALSSRSAQAALVPGATPPTGSTGDKTLVMDPKNGITLKEGHMGVATITGKDSSISGMYEASIKVQRPRAQRAPEIRSSRVKARTRPSSIRWS